MQFSGASVWIIKIQSRQKPENKLNPTYDFPDKSQLQNFSFWHDFFFLTKLKSCCMGSFVEPSIIALHTSVLLNLENVYQLNQQRRLFSYYEKDWNSPRLPHFQQPTLHGGFIWWSVHTVVSVQLRPRATEFGWKHLHGELNTNSLSLPMPQLEAEAFERLDITVSLWKNRILL